MKTGTKHSLPKHVAEKRDVVLVSGRYTVRMFYFKMEKRCEYIYRLKGHSQRVRAYFKQKKFEVRGEGRMNRARSLRRQKWMHSRTGIDWL